MTIIIVLLVSLNLRVQTINENNGNRTYSTEKLETQIKEVNKKDNDYKFIEESSKAVVGISKLKTKDKTLFGNENIGVKGNPVGHGSSGGSSWSVSGRGIKGSLPKPANTFNQEGRVIVEIRVNAKGDVVSVTPKGGTVTDKKTIQMALDAARKAKFTEGDHEQIGTITYNFKFN